LLARLTAPTDAPARIAAVPGAVIDVGSNTVRLLVARPTADGIVAVRQEKAFVGLGAEILRHGLIRPAKLEEAAAVARRFARVAAKLGAEPIEVVVTAPGRQAENGDELVDALARATRLPVRLVTREEEGALAYRGAVLAGGAPEGTLAVCDVGGGSTEIAVGEPPGEPVWVRSIDLGSLRLTASAIASDPPHPEELAGAEEDAAEQLARLTPPRPQAALAVGGSARALARLVGPTLDERTLTEALTLTAGLPADELAGVYGLDRARASVLPAGAIILREVVRLLGVPLALAGGGLREGALAELLAQAEAA
jgi:exopolyphosphatase / guanosine-5'-triphosphate,3'-diphosphate pyrophosphatase